METILIIDQFVAVEQSGVEGKDKAFTRCDQEKRIVLALMNGSQVLPLAVMLPLFIVLRAFPAVLNFAKAHIY